MKYLKIAVFLFTSVIGLTACGVICKNPMPSFQPKETITTSEIETVSRFENESHHDDLPDDPMFDRIEDRCKEIESLYHTLFESAEKTEPTTRWEYPLLSQSSIDSIENLLYNAGYDMIDTNEPYPGYLTTSDRFYAFWDAVQQHKDAEQEAIMVLKSGCLSYRLFTYNETGGFVYSMTYYPDEIKEPYYENMKSRTGN